MTLFIGDMECDNLLEDVTKYHCLIFKEYHVDNFYIFCNTDDIMLETKNSFEGMGCSFYDISLLLKFINSNNTTGLIYQNILGFDLPVMNKLSGITYDYQSINNRKLFIADTLVMSRYLHPDRQLPKGCPTSVLNVSTGKRDKIGPHSLEAWGYRVGHNKIEVHDWRNQTLDIYINRCYNDVIINELMYDELLKEMNDVAIPNGNKLGDWKKPIRMAHKVSWLMYKQQETGVCFDIQGAKDLVIRIEKEMKEIEEAVEPSLGNRELPDSQQPSPPENPWKKPFDFTKVWTQKKELRQPVLNYLNLIGYTDSENQKKYINQVDEESIKLHHSLLTTSAIAYGKKIGVEDLEELHKLFLSFKEGIKPPVLKEKLCLSHKKDVKEFLIKEGWQPTMWKSRNITIEPKTKKKLSDESINIKLDAYIKEFEGSVYWPFILEDLGYKKEYVDTSTKAFRDRCIKKGRELKSSPQYADQRGELCKNLEALAGDVAKKIVRWLSLQNRKNTILSDNGTGWLTHPRLKVDGRLPASSSGITPTFRKKHSIIVNIPKPKDHVVLGKEMRGLFIAPENYYNVGADGVSLEAMVASHYTIPFDGGKYAEGVLSGSFHDDNAKAYSEVTGNLINRDDGKNFTYMIMYGGSGKKAAKMASVPEQKGQEIIDAFWETNEGLRKVKETVEKYWELTGNKYIYGLDGRKVFTRSHHSLLNCLFQHTGALILDFAQCYSYDLIIKNKNDIQRWGEFHDESQVYEHKSDIEIYYFDEKPESYRDGKLYSKPKQLDDGKWIQYYAPYGEYLDKGFIMASKYFKTNVEFRVEYMVGESWAQCH